MHRWPAAALFLAGCGYSSTWPDPAAALVDTGGAAATDRYHQPGTPPCSASDPTLAPAQLTVVNGASVALWLHQVSPGSCQEIPLVELPPGGDWSQEVDSNLVFVVRGRDGGLLRWFQAPPGSTWYEALP